MIVVCGDFASSGERRTGAVEIARRAAVAGAGVQLVGILADEAEGDAWLLELGTAGIGHAAVLREPARDIEAADLELALRYLPEVRVIVVIGVPPAVVAAAAQHAAWSGAALVVIDRAAGAGDAPAPELPDGATVLEAPPSDPDGTFAGFVGAFAARLDAGATPADAWAETTRALAVDPA